MIDLVENLATTWTSIGDLCDGLTEEQWKRPTGCPGWSVQDNLAHLVDYETFALGRPRPDHQVADMPHARNDMGRMNEVGVDARRARPGDEVLAEFRQVTAARMEHLRGLSEDDLEVETQTPVGPGTVRELLTLRTMDTWSHEQDIRRALGVPGHTRGPAAATAIGYLGSFLPYAVAKKAGAPDGTTAVFLVGEFPPVAVEIHGGRGRAADTLPERPTVLARIDPSNFQALTCGRTDADPDAVDIAGDEELGRRIAGSLGFMP